jgi:hypothetical protein
MIGLALEVFYIVRAAPRVDGRIREFSAIIAVKNGPTLVGGKLCLDLIKEQNNLRLILG